MGKAIKWTIYTALAVVLFAVGAILWPLAICLFVIAAVIRLVLVVAPGPGREQD